MNMKKNILVWALIAASFTACQTAGSREKQNQLVDQLMKDSTQIQVMDSLYNFGNVTEGQVVTFSFRFKNTGSKPLIIKNAIASCGCTKPEWPSEPIPPGSEGTIKARFNSEGRVGPAHKEITVEANSKPGFPKLILEGEVKKK